MGKTIITGPGRAGSSFLIMLLTRLGFDTGYKPYKESYNGGIRAGCEWHIAAEYSQPAGEIKAALDQAPEVMKSPEWGLVMKEFCRRGLMEVDHCYIPFRDLDVAARSRIDAGLFWQVCPSDNNHLVMDQASVHALALGRTLEACLVFNIPYTIMQFPAFVCDEQLCYNKLSEGLDFDRQLFGTLFRELSNPKQIKWRSDGERNRDVAGGT